MKIAYISFEYPPHTAIGGIATYTESVANLMAARGHHVEVFAWGPETKTGTGGGGNKPLVHYIQTQGRDIFHREIVPFFTSRHRQVAFDLAEAPEYSYEGMGVLQAFPDLPLITRFHTPAFLVKELNKKYAGTSFSSLLKKSFGLGQYVKEKDPEFRQAKLSAGLSAPSRSMATIIKDRWDLDNIRTIPNPFIPPASLLDIPENTSSNRVTYFGRLEIRKGVVQLAAAIPLVLAARPDLRFRFIGKPNYAPGKKEMMDVYLKKRLAPFLSSIDFVPHLPKEKIPAALADTDICIFPSYWENFGYTCVEAMAAARGVLASKFGGMQDMLEDVAPDWLIDPMHPEEMAEKIITLAGQPVLRAKTGLLCREKVLAVYGNQTMDATASFYSGIAAGRKEA